MIFPTEVERAEERERKKALGQLKDPKTLLKTQPKPRGGYRPNAGRKSRYTTPTTRAVVHIPAAFIEALTECHETLQAALEAYALQLDPSLSEYIKK